MFDRAAVFQISGNARRAEGVTANALDADAARKRAALNHAQDVRATHSRACQGASFTGSRGEERRFPLVGQTSRDKVRIQISFSIVMNRNFVELPTLFV